MKNIGIGELIAIVFVIWGMVDMIINGSTLPATHISIILGSIGGGYLLKSNSLPTN